jgi:HSP90 family molecular chaperone
VDITIRKTTLVRAAEHNAIIFGGRFVLAIKDEGTYKDVWKARFVVQRYGDHLKTPLVHDTATSRQHSSRVLVGLASIFGFNLISTDVIQAYIQSAENFFETLTSSRRRNFQWDLDSCSNFFGHYTAWQIVVTTGG